jgi:hypothetical protein
MPRRVAGSADIRTELTHNSRGILTPTADDGAQQNQPTVRCADVDEQEHHAGPGPSGPSASRATSPITEPAIAQPERHRRGKAVRKALSSRGLGGGSRPGGRRRYPFGRPGDGVIDGGAAANRRSPVCPCGPGRRQASDRVAPTERAAPAGRVGPGPSERAAPAGRVGPGPSERAAPAGRVGPGPSERAAPRGREGPGPGAHPGPGPGGAVGPGPGARVGPGPSGPAGPGAQDPGAQGLGALAPGGPAGPSAGGRVRSA